MREGGFCKETIINKLLLFHLRPDLGERLLRQNQLHVSLAFQADGSWVRDALRQNLPVSALLLKYKYRSLGRTQPLHFFAESESVRNDCWQHFLIFSLLQSDGKSTQCSRGSMSDPSPDLRACCVRSEWRGVR